MKNVYMAPGRGLDSASAAPCGGPGFAMHHREYGQRVCPGKGKPCGDTFTPNTPNGKVLRGVPQVEALRFAWEP